MLLRYLFLAATLLSTAFVDAAQCNGGALDQSVINDQILKLINYRRSDLVQGKVLNGWTPSFLPAGQNMDKIDWSCDLERDAMSGASMNNCMKPSAPSGKTPLFYYSPTQEPAAPIVLSWLNEIYGVQLDNVGNDVRYAGEWMLDDFVNLANAKTTEIGCAFGNCQLLGQNSYTFYCLTNQAPLNNGEIIYQKGTGGCDNCDPGTICNSTTKLCEKVAASPNQPVNPYQPVNPSQVVYPSGGSNTKCPNTGMTDALRTSYLDMHNYRRSLLALGQVTKNNGNFLPKAANMLKLALDCNLEAGAIAYASTCPYAVSAMNTRTNIGEHYHRVAVSSQTPTYQDGLKSAVTDWWKVVRHNSGIGMQAAFRANHVNTPIETFTQMGWAMTSKLGCSIVKCSTDYVVICRYSPKGNVVENNVYIPGNPCTQCSNGCDSSLGLCNS